MNEPGGAGPATPAAGMTAAAASAGRAALVPVSGDIAPPVASTARAAAITGAWQAVESTLQPALPAPSRRDSTLPQRQDLVRALRQNDLISLEQGHALLDLIAIADRARQPEYEFTDDDVTAAQDALVRLQPPPAAPGAPAVGAATRDDAAGATTRPVPSSLDATGLTEASAPRADGPRRTAAYFVGGLLMLVLAAGGLAFAIARHGVTGRFGGWPFRESARERGVAAYDAGRRSEAQAAFREAEQADSTDPVAHVYLGRLARETGDLNTARGQLITAVRLAPTSALAQRELGAFYLASGNLDLARRFYARAVALDPTDKSAQGFLACALTRLHRSGEAVRFLARAGPGPWTACASATAGDSASPVVPPASP